MRFAGEAERRVKEEKRRRVGDEEGGDRERGFREETGMGVPFRGGVEGGFVLFLGVLGVVSLVVGVEGDPVEGCEPTDLVELGGGEMTPRTSSCSEAEKGEFTFLEGGGMQKEGRIQEIPQLRQ